MAKFRGRIGFVENKESTDPENPSVWRGEVIEKLYRGDVIRLGRSLSEGQSVNDDTIIDNQLSIIADEYANQHFFAIRYLRWMGGIWEIKKVQVLRPRLILTLGGVYNGPTA